MTEYDKEEDLGKTYDTQLAARLITYLNPYRWVVGVSIFTTAIHLYSSTCRPLFDQDCYRSAHSQRKLPRSCIYRPHLFIGSYQSTCPFVPSGLFDELDRAKDHV